MTTKKIALTGLALGRNQRFVTLDAQDYYRLAPYRWFWKENNGGPVRDEYDANGRRTYVRMLDALAEGGPKLYRLTPDPLDLRREVLTTDPERAVRMTRAGNTVVVERGPTPDEQRAMARLIAEELFRLAQDDSA